MEIYTGISQHVHGAEVVTEACHTFPVSKPLETGERDALDIVFVFSSPRQHQGSLYEALQARFPGAMLVGCVTRGGHYQGGRHVGGAVIVGLRTPEIEWSALLIEELSELDEARTARSVSLLFESLGLARDALPYQELFTLMFIDGCDGLEEQVTAMLDDALEGIPLIGGSAGGAGNRAFVFHDHGVFTDAAVLVMGRSKLPFEIVKSHHFAAGERLLAITRADVSERRVYEIDGYPAAQAYARALGLGREGLTADALATHPLTVRCRGERYTRAIRGVNADDSLSFYGVVEEGMVLEVGRPRGMVEALEERWGSLEAELLLGCSCVLRTCEAEQEEVDRALKRLAAHSVGCDTWGVQLDGMHVHQTMVALALGARFTS